MYFLGIFILIIFIIVVVIYSKKNKNNNNFKIDKNIIETYKKMILSDRKLVMYQKMFIILGIVLGILVIILLLNFLYQRSINYIIIILIFVIMMVLIFIFQAYGNNYKEKVVKKAIKDYNPNLTYEPFNGMDRSDYDFAKFEYFEVYKSEDLIKGTIMNLPFIMADVHTFRRQTDKDNKTTYITIFEGSVAKLDLNINLKAFIYIINNQIKLFNNDYYVTIDNENFEKIYDVYSDNDLLTMKILTPSVTNAILDLQSKTGIYTEIKIYNDVIYFRFYTGDLFNPIMFNTLTEAENLYLSILILKNIDEIMKNILQAIKEGI